MEDPIFTQSRPHGTPSQPKTVRRPGKPSSITAAIYLHRRHVPLATAGRPQYRSYHSRNRVSECQTHKGPEDNADRHVSTLMSGQTEAYEQADDSEVARRDTNQKLKRLRNLSAGRFSCSDGIRRSPAIESKSASTMIITHMIDISAGTKARYIVLERHQASLLPCLSLRTYIVLDG